jgi:hypothetical protein
MEVKKYHTFKDRYNNKEGYKLEYIKKYNSPKICECGISVNGLSMYRHLKSKKHADIMNILNTFKTQKN